MGENELASGQRKSENFLFKNAQSKILVSVSAVSCVVLVLLGTAVWKKLDRKPVGNQSPQISKHYIKLHERLIERAKGVPIDLIFIGDSLTEHWLIEGKDTWNREFAHWHPGNFGISGDTTYGVLWRLKQNAISSLHPKVVVVLIGTNDLSVGRGPEATAHAIRKVVQTIKLQLPNTTVVLLGLLPRNWRGDPARKLVREVNETISSLDNGRDIVYLDVGNSFLDQKGELIPELMADAIHLSANGYKVFAEALKPTLRRYLESDSPS